MQRVSLPPVNNDQDSHGAVDGAIVLRRNVGALLPRGVSEPHTERILKVVFQTHNHPGSGS